MSKVLIGVLCSLCVCCFPFRVPAQQPAWSNDLRFDNFTGQNHFISDGIACVRRAKNGYLWAAANGLYRFDGRKYTQYSNLTNRQHGFRHNYVPYIVEDDYGRLWTGSGGGLCYFDEKGNKFHYVDIDAQHKIDHAFALCIAGNNLWFTYNEGVARLDLKSLKITQTSIRFTTGAIGNFSIDSNTIVSTMTSGGYIIYDIRQDKYRTVYLENNRGIGVFSVALAQNRIWLGTGNGLWVTDNINAEPVRIRGTEDLSISDIELAPGLTGDSILWIGTFNKGLSLYNIRTAGVEHTYRHDELNPHSILSDNVLDIFADKTNLVWIATGSGVSLFNYANQFFKEQPLPGKYIIKAAHDRFDSNTVWLSSYTEGMLKADWRTKEVKEFIPIWDVKNKKSPGLDVYDMLQLGREQWLLLGVSGLAVWDSRKGVQQQIGNFPMGQGVISQYLRYIIPYNKDTCFISGTNGLYIFHIPRGTVDTAILRHDTTFASDPDITHGFYDGKHDLWLASRGGLYRYDISSGKYWLFKVDSKNRFDNFMNDVVMDKSGRLLCATGGGMVLFDTALKKFTIVNSFNDIVNPSCAGVIIRNGLIWINSNAGLISLSLDMRKCNIYYPEQWRSSMIFGQINEELIVYMRNKMLYFNPAQTLNRFRPSGPVIEKMRINDSTYYFPSGSAPLPLSYDQNMLNFSFTAFEFSDPEKIRFRYRLDGLSDKWIYAEQSEANFTHLPAGSYTFLVQSGSSNGEWNGGAASYSFIISPPWWQTWWFRSGVLLSFIGLVTGIAWLRIRSIKRREAEKTQANKDVAEMEMKALRSQMNPHFIFNSLNSIQKFIWENKQEDAAEYLTKFSRLMRLILENSMHKLVTLEQELATLNLYLELEHRRCNNQFDYSVAVDDRIDQGATLVPPLILQPYVENAIWHGLMHKEERGLLKISISGKNPRYLLCVIEDNGIGRAASGKIASRKEKKTLSYGMQITRQRLDMAYKSSDENVIVEDLCDELQQAAGTRITITLPAERFEKI